MVNKEKTASEGDLTNPMRYSGEYYYSESGMYYLRARYYDPEIARFISEDSYEGNNQDPLSLNLYTYCRNNPVTRIDLSGNVDLELGSVTSGVGGIDPLTLWMLYQLQQSSTAVTNVVLTNAQGIQSVVYMAANNGDKIFGNNSGNSSSSSGNNLDPNKFDKGSKFEKIIEISQKKMYQLGDHYIRHGKDMGYKSKTEYDAAAKEFANLYQNNPSANIYEGIWNGHGQLNGTIQRIINFNNQTVIMDKAAGQIIDFYVGSEFGGLIKITEVIFQ